MMLYKNMKTIIYSLDDDTDFFDIVTEVLPWSLTLYTMKSIDLMKEVVSLKTQMISHENYYWCRLQKWSGHSWGYTCSNQISAAKGGAISSSNGNPVKLVNQFRYLGSNNSSESNINIC